MIGCLIVLWLIGEFGEEPQNPRMQCHPLREGHWRSGCTAGVLVIIPIFVTTWPLLHSTKGVWFAEGVLFVEGIFSAECELKGIPFLIVRLFCFWLEQPVKAHSRTTGVPTSTIESSHGNWVAEIKERLRGLTEITDREMNKSLWSIFRRRLRRRNLFEKQKTDGSDLMQSDKTK
jgi:hypothetical protein